jgi:cyclase
LKNQPTIKHYTIHPLSGSVFAALAEEGGAAISNAGLVDLGDSTLIIDTFLTPSAAEDLRADALRITGRSPRWVINTHYHNDHIWGNQVFLPEAELISTTTTRGLIQTAGKAEYDEYRGMAANQYQKLLAQQASAKTDQERKALDLWLGYFGGLARDLPRLRVTPPGLVFDHKLSLHGSHTRAELVEFSGAHTGSDLVVFIPEERVLFMSDLLFVNFHPYLADGNPERWLEVLQTILGNPDGLGSAERFVPGHGPVGTRADVQRLADYIQDCQRIARELAEKGQVSDTDVETVAIPEAYKEWVMPRFFYSNLKFLLQK